MRAREGHGFVVNIPVPAASGLRIEQGAEGIIFDQIRDVLRHSRFFQQRGRGDDDFIDGMEFFRHPVFFRHLTDAHADVDAVFHGFHQIKAAAPVKGDMRIGF